MSQLVPLSKATIGAQQSAAKWHQIPDTNGSATHEVSFMSSLPPVGFSIYTLTPQKPSEVAAAHDTSSVTLAGPWTKQEVRAHPTGRTAEKDEEIALEGGLCAVISRKTGHLEVSLL